MFLFSKRLVTLKDFKKALIAVGGKPYVMSDKECPGFHHAITSDDVFFLKEQPKKMVVLGGGYIATECASFFNKLGTEVHMFNRSRPMRKYDNQIADYIIESFTTEGMQILNGVKFTEIQKNKDGTLTVHYFDEETQKVHKLEKVDVVLAAISRFANSELLNLKAIPKLKLADDKLKGGFKGEYDRVSENVYAVGDCLAGVPELTPIAIKSGRKLADKLQREFDGLFPLITNVDIEFFPSTIFTWPEYSFCGLSEESAKLKFGDNKVISYHSRRVLLESALEPEHKTNTYVKIICVKQDDQGERVVGMHYVGANAGEVMQGFAVRLLVRFKKRIHKRGT